MCGTTMLIHALQQLMRLASHQHSQKRKVPLQAPSAACNEHEPHVSCFKQNYGNKDMPASTCTACASRVSERCTRQHAWCCLGAPLRARQSSQLVDAPKILS
jgi:hypothetical protein